MDTGCKYVAKGSHPSWEIRRRCGSVHNNYIWPKFAQEKRCWIDPSWGVPEDDYDVRNALWSSAGNPRLTRTTPFLQVLGYVCRSRRHWHKLAEIQTTVSCVRAGKTVRHSDALRPHPDIIESRSQALSKTQHIHVQKIKEH